MLNNKSTDDMHKMLDKKIYYKIEDLDGIRLVKKLSAKKGIEIPIYWLYVILYIRFACIRKLRLKALFALGLIIANAIVFATTVYVGKNLPKTYLILICVYFLLSVIASYQLLLKIHRYARMLIYSQSEIISVIHMIKKNHMPPDYKDINSFIDQDLAKNGKAYERLIHSFWDSFESMDKKELAKLIYK